MFRFITLLVALVFTISAQAGPTGSETVVVIKTTLGEVKVKLYDGTPTHRDNFIKLVKSGAYDHMLFHRAIKGMNVQTGDPSTIGSNNVAPTNAHLGTALQPEIKPEYFHKAGALVMSHALGASNSDKLSSGSQFYIVTGRVYTPEQLALFELRRNKANGTDTFKFSEAQIEAYRTVGGLPQMDDNFTVFGEVVEGLDVVVSISETPIDGKYKPLSPVEIISVEIQ